MFSIVENKKLKDMAERILHVPGNYSGGILEMTLVLDFKMEKEYIKETAEEIIKALKSKGEVFRNVRLNVVRWKSDEHIVNEVTAMPLLLMDGFYEDFVREDNEKQSELLMENLKKFHARSKLVIIISDDFAVKDTGRFKTAVTPFLERKSILIKRNVCYDLYRDFKSIT